MVFVDYPIAYQLRRVTGLAIGLGGTLGGAAAFWHRWSELGLPATQAIGDPNVWTLFLFAVLGLATAAGPHRIGMYTHLSVLYVTAIGAALTSVPGDLTCIMFFGLYIAFVTVYVHPSRLRSLIYGTTTSVFVAVWTIGHIVVTEATPAQFVLSYVGAGTSTALILAIIYSLSRSQKNHDRLLQKRVRVRTRELQAALEQSDQLLEQNQILLREVHHRTKNNLQVIASLLSLRRTEDELSHEEYRASLEAAQTQIHTIATVHEMFHQEDTTAMVSLTSFIERAGELWGQNYEIDDLVVEKDFASDLSMSMDFAIPLGLILHELVANAKEHAYTEAETKSVRVEISRDDAFLNVAVRDFGSGFPAGVSIEHPERSGLQIVMSLAEQIHATVTCTTGTDGTEFRLACQLAPTQLATPRPLLSVG
jgi:two-component sensor histidine kinase